MFLCLKKIELNETTRNHILIVSTQFKTTLIHSLFRAYLIKLRKTWAPNWVKTGFRESHFAHFSLLRFINLSFIEHNVTCYGLLDALSHNHIKYAMILSYENIFVWHFFTFIFFYLFIAKSAHEFAYNCLSCSRGSKSVSSTSNYYRLPEHGQVFVF